jgi:peroxiredoxin Q/BCP
LARLRDDYQLFQSRGAEILAVGPDTAIAFGLYWRAERLPFVGLPDPGHKVALCYKQQVNLLKLGRMPLATVIDRHGLIRFAHYGASMSDIPDERSLLDVIDGLNDRSE